MSPFSVRRAASGSLMPRRVVSCLRIALVSSVTVPSAVERRPTDLPSITFISALCARRLARSHAFCAAEVVRNASATRTALARIAAAMTGAAPSARGGRASLSRCATSTRWYRRSTRPCASVVRTSSFARTSADACVNSFVSRICRFAHTVNVQIKERSVASATSAQTAAARFVVIAALRSRPRG
jgi:hypothetical protein